MRLRLLSATASHAGGEAYVCDMSGGIDVSQPTVSHHLKVLRNADVLTSTAGKRRNLVQIQDGRATVSNPARLV